jgi:hypothetical protein
VRQRRQFSVRPTRLVSGLLLAAVLGATTYTCDPPPGTPLCQFPDKVEVAFIGTAIATNYDPFERQQGNWYRFKVEERLLGVPNSQAEILAWTSIGSGEVKVGSRYFVHAVWDGVHSSYRMAVCGNTRPVAQATDDIRYLRSRNAGTFRSYVSGSVLRNYTGHPFNNEYRVRGLPGASVVLKGSGRTLRAVADAAGHFRFDEVRPGQYTLTAIAPGYVQRGEFTLSVPQGGCGLAEAGVFTNASISGTVLKHDGTPAVGAKIGLLDTDPALARPHDDPRQRVTDSSGRFSLTNLPSGRFLLGVNIDGIDRYPGAIPPTFYPGVTSPGHAAVIALRPNEARKNLTLRLPPPREMREVRIQLKWPDGLVAKDGAIDAWLRKDIYESQYDLRDGVAVLRLMKGVDYWITAGALDGRRHWIYTDKYLLRGGDDDVFVTLTPRYPEPQWSRAVYP